MLFRREHTKTLGGSSTRILALLLISCLVQCATEQRVISRGKTANVGAKVNGWRTPRGGPYSTKMTIVSDITRIVNCQAKGSCLSYGHSCWGAHGKRSGKPPAATDWYLTRLLRRMLTDQELNGARDAPDDGDLRAIYKVDAEENSAENVKQSGENEIMPMAASNTRRYPGGVPMLDYDALTNTKFIQMMRAAPETENK